MTFDASMGSGSSIPPVTASPWEKLSLRSTVVRDMDDEMDADAEGVALDEELARLDEARAERDELLLDLEETRVSIMWLEAELRGLRNLRQLGSPAGRPSKRLRVRRPAGVWRAVWAAAGAIALVATLWVLR
jgi:hypothetical protein